MCVTLQLVMCDTEDMVLGAQELALPEAHIEGQDRLRFRGNCCAAQRKATSGTAQLLTEPLVTVLLLPAEPCVLLVTTA